jgi:hypothetical protein
VIVSCYDVIFDWVFCRRCGEFLKSKRGAKDTAEKDEPESPQSTARARKYRACVDVLAADFENALKNKGKFYIDHPGDPEPPHAMAFAQGGWEFTNDGPVVLDEYLPRNTQTGRP